MKKVMILTDLAEPLKEDQSIGSKQLNTKEWVTERHIFQALKRLGYDPYVFGLFDEIAPLAQKLKDDPPHIVFNIAEAIRNERNYEPNIASAVELSGVPYTGASPLSLSLCKNKEITKKLLTFHHIKVPDFLVSPRNNPLRSYKNFKFPGFVKPLGEESSDGIARASFVNSEKECLERVSFVHEQGYDALIEEFIDGRELYVGLLGHQNLKDLAPREIVFTEMPDNQPKFATFKAKWDDKYRKKWGIRNTYAKTLPKEVEKHLGTICKKTGKILQVQGYGRVDLRITDDHQIYVIEVNPNPALASDDDFAMGAKKSGIVYDDLIEKIIQFGLKRYQGSR